MKPGTIFISHRAEYGNLVRELKKAIETTSRGKIEAIISEDLPGAEKWRSAIKTHLEDAEIWRLHNRNVALRGPLLHPALKLVGDVAQGIPGHRI